MRIPSPKIAGRTSRIHVEPVMRTYTRPEKHKKKINSHTKISLPEIDVEALFFIMVLPVLKIGYFTRGREIFYSEDCKTGRKLFLRNMGSVHSFLLDDLKFFFGGFLEIQFEYHASLNHFSFWTNPAS